MFFIFLLWIYYVLMPIWWPLVCYLLTIAVVSWNFCSWLNPGEPTLINPHPSTSNDHLAIGCPLQLPQLYMCRILRYIIIYRRFIQCDPLIVITAQPQMLITLTSSTDYPRWHLNLNENKSMLCVIFQCYRFSLGKFLYLLFKFFYNNRKGCSHIFRLVEFQVSFMDDDYVEVSVEIFLFLILLTATGGH